MTPKNNDNPLDENSLGVLDDAASLDTTGIGILGGTAQVSVTMPQEADDDLDDDAVLEGEVVVDLIVDASAASIGDADITRPALASSVIEYVIDAEAEDQRADDESTAEEPVDDDSSADELPEDELPEDELADEELAAEELAAEELAEEELAGEEVADEELAEEELAEEELADEISADEEFADQVPSVDVASAAEAPEDESSAEAAEHVSARADEQAAAEFLAQAKADQEAADAAAVSLAVSAAVVAPSPRVAPAPIEKESTIVSTGQEKSAVARTTRATARKDVALTSKRLDDLSESGRESADLLTADRLLDPHRVAKPEPEGAWSHFLYTISGRRINIGDGRRARERKALSARIAAPITGGARFIPVLSRKGGVGKTTITALLGMSLADARDDRVIAVDANPDRGTLADRVVRPNHTKTVRDLVRIHDQVRGYHDISAIVARDATRLDVLASDTDPRIAEAFSDDDYRDVADVAAHYYSLVLTDTGTGIVHSVMAATLDLADQLVIVSGLSVDEARLASETLTWLETNGYAEQARDAIVVLNQSTPGAPLVRLNELQSHFTTRVRKVVRMPYDPQIAGGGTIVFAHLQPETRAAARELAALLVESLRAKVA